MRYLKLFQLHYKISTSRCRLPKSLQRYTCPPKRKLHTESIGDETPLRGKERNLKDVLKHLHDEFEQLNQQVLSFAFVGLLF